jgi:hypothetical protein
MASNGIQNCHLCDITCIQLEGITNQLDPTLGVVKLDPLFPRVPGWASSIGLLLIGGTLVQHHLTLFCGDISTNDTSNMLVVYNMQMGRQNQEKFR